MSSVDADNNINIIINGTTLINAVQTINNGADGGVAYLNGPYISFTLTGSSIVNGVTSSGRGGLIYVENALSVNIYQATLVNMNSLMQGSIVYSKSPCLSLQLYNNIISGSLITNTTNLPYLLSRISTVANAFHIENAKSIDSNSNIIRNFYLADAGAAFYLQNTTLTENSSIYLNNGAIYGGVFYC